MGPLVEVAFVLIRTDTVVLSALNRKPGDELNVECMPLSIPVREKRTTLKVHLSCRACNVSKAGDIHSAHRANIETKQTTSDNRDSGDDVDVANLIHLESCTQMPIQS